MASFEVGSVACPAPISNTERSEAVGVQSPPRSGTKNRKRLTGSRLLYDTQGPASSLFLTRAFINVQFLFAVAWIILRNCIKRNADRVCGERGGGLNERDLKVYTETKDNTKIDLKEQDMRA